MARTKNDQGAMLGGYERWAHGHGVINHNAATRQRIQSMAKTFSERGIGGDGVPFFDLLVALDRVANAAMWLVVHATYARNVYLDGRPLQAEDFKTNPQGHVGGSLNIVPAYAAALAFNAATSVTRPWLMGQGHCVSAIDSVNLLVGNMTNAHAARYDISDQGLSRFARDFYSYRLTADGRPDSPLGSHVNIHTAGGLIEGGFLGFAELLYPHMPLKGEDLIVFLSDGAFEEQRGGDWAPRWWRAEDSGRVFPIMIANGRRIDQRTLADQAGGSAWLEEHLRLNSFDPLVFDGRDPAAFVWALFEMNERYAAFESIPVSARRYPFRIPYGIAAAPKGAGFFGEGTNAAHSLPLGASPHDDPTAANRFNACATKLHVAPGELRSAAAFFAKHRNRTHERDHPLAHRKVSLDKTVEPEWLDVKSNQRQPGSWIERCAMAAIDDVFLRTVDANPALRPRMGNPDESKSNHMYRTLAALKHRVDVIESPSDEAICGGVITALNEEAVVCAALGNKGGINIAVTYEAFGVKMQSALRQDISFADQANAAGCHPQWLSWPLILTSHTWENAKNERSHQDPSLGEALLGEPSDVCRVVFPADYNSAAAVMAGVFRTQGQIWIVIAPKQDVPSLLSKDEAKHLLKDGALRLTWAEHNGDHAKLTLIAIGAYQLTQAVLASTRLKEAYISYRFIYMLEPARFRAARTEREAVTCKAKDDADRLLGDTEACLIVTHTRPEPMTGLLQPLLSKRRSKALGYFGAGGTLTTAGLLYANRSSHAHILEACAELTGGSPATLLSPFEIETLEGRGDPNRVIR
jgi:phosphoketolase